MIILCNSIAPNVSILSNVMKKWFEIKQISVQFQNFLVKITNRSCYIIVWREFICQDRTIFSSIIFCCFFFQKKRGVAMIMSPFLYRDLCPLWCKLYGRKCLHTSKMADSTSEAKKGRSHIFRSATHFHEHVVMSRLESFLRNKSINTWKQVLGDVRDVALFLISHEQTH